MALIQCPECNKEISDKATACPQCGCPIDSQITTFNDFEFNGVKYDISDIIAKLDIGKLSMASILISSVLSKYPKQIECEIWNYYTAYKEKLVPNLTEPSSILKYNYTGRDCDICRQIWWLEKGNRIQAFKEMYFAFPYGEVKDANEESKRINMILDDMQRQLNNYKVNKQTIVYPRWFLKWHAEVAAQNVANLPKCPTCGSSNVRALGAGTRIASGAIFGFFSKTARSQFICNECKYKW